MIVSGLVVFLGGGIGALSRWMISSFVNSLGSSIWPGTLAVNLLGCLIYYLAVRYISVEFKLLPLFLKVGLLGSLTTFSTFSYELLVLLKSGRIGEMVLVLILNVLFGIVIGWWILR